VRYPPEGNDLAPPGIPSLLVTYGTATDLFFSGHTAIAVFGCVELARMADRFADPRCRHRGGGGERGCCAARALHDGRLTAIVTALWAVSVADVLAPGVDLGLQPWSARRADRARYSDLGGLDPRLGAIGTFGSSWRSRSSTGPLRAGAAAECRRVLTITGAGAGA